MKMSIADKLMGKGPKVEEKKIIEFIKPVDESIKTKLHGMAGSGFGASEPCLITIELIRDAIAEWKQEKQIFSQEITQTNCTELALSFRNILQISNLENLINVHTLRLDNNMIMRIENLGNLKNIKWLDLSFNYISEIEGLDELTNLTDLSLFRNDIVEVKNLDKNRKLNVLSVGKNLINDCKALATYLKRFSNLQALCVHMNPFCKDEESVQKILESNQQTCRYPGSYEPLIQALPNLKYLDWKPINEKYRESVQNNYLNAGKEDKTATDAANEEKLMQERAELENADLGKIIGFFDKVLKTIKDDINEWDNLIKIPGLDDQIALAEKGFNEDLKKFKEDILAVQKEKDAIMNQRKKELDQNEEKFIEKSKEMIREFKRVFKKFCSDLKSGKISDVKTQDEAVKYVGLEELKNNLLEIEIWEKQKLKDFINQFKKEVSEKNTIMQERTDVLRQSLDAKKNGLKEKIGQIVSELKIKIDQYNEAIDKPEDGKEGDEEEEVPKDKKMEELSSIFSSPEFGSDLEKITENMDSEITKLRDELESARVKSFDNYFNKINNDEYYRNKKRIQDIKEIYQIYWEKIKNELDNFQKPKDNLE